MDSHLPSGKPGQGVETLVVEELDLRNKIRKQLMERVTGVPNIERESIAAPALIWC